MMHAHDRLLAATRGQPVDRVPVWLMRQAGRYLPEYRALRAQHDFLTLCKTPELAAEITLQPWRRFGMDGVVVFCDILIPVEAMGLGLTIGEAYRQTSRTCGVEGGTQQALPVGGASSGFAAARSKTEGFAESMTRAPEITGPRLTPPVTTMADVQRLRVPEPERAVPFLLQTLRMVRETVGNHAAVIGFAGGPWTLATYMVSGGVAGSRDAAAEQLRTQSTFREALLEKLVATTVPYLAAQVRAGAQVLQIFDTWAGMLPTEEFTRYALPALTAIVTQVRAATNGTVPIIVYCNECRHIVEPLGATGADVVSIDWRVTLTEARRRLPATVAIQGNLHPEVMLQSADDVRSATTTMLREAGTTGYIANLGHGVIKATPVENVAAFVETVQNFGR